jgi:hypothetical protein
VHAATAHCVLSFKRQLTKADSSTSGKTLARK